MNDILHQPGFLGTAGNWAVDFTLVMSLIVAILFNVGFVLARQDNIKWHARVQTLGAVINLILVAWMMILPFRDFVVKGEPSYGPARVVTILHAIFGVSALVFGWFVILRGHGYMIKSLKFQNYKLFMRVAYGLYMTATVLGIAIYFTWFVFNPNPPTYG